MEKCIGTYKGIKCYRVSKDDLIKKLHIFHTYDEDVIYIVEDGRMVYQKEIIGYYDGERVEEYVVPYAWKDNTESKKEMKEKTNTESGKEMKNNFNISEAIGMEINEIKFSDYSTIVDDFFRNLEGAV